MSDQSGTADGGAPTEGATTETTETGPPEWLGPITSKLDELGETTSQLAQQYADAFKQEEPEAEFDYDGDFYDEDGEITEEGARHLIGSEVDDRVKAALAERDARDALREREDAFEALRAEIPALADDKLAARLVNEVAEELRDEYGEETAKQIIGRPLFVRFVEQYYKAGLYDDGQAQSEDAEDDQEVVLESATGASATRKKKDEPDWGDRIVKAAESARPQI